MQNKANENFIQNLNNLLRIGQKVPTQMEYEDRTKATAITIGQVNETYIVDEYYDIYPGFYNLPIQSFRATPVMSGIKEIYWIYFLQSNKLEDLQPLKILNWWNKFTLRNKKYLTKEEVKEFDNTIGKAYGYTVRKFDLLSEFIRNVVAKPYSRDLILSLWQEDDIKFQRKMGGLLPCVHSFRLSLFETDDYNLCTFTLYQRSSDYLTANSINKSEYFALFLYIIDCVNNQYVLTNNFKNKPLRFHKFIHNVDDLHIYDRHFDIAEEYIIHANFVHNEPTLIKYNFNIDKKFYESFTIVKPKAFDTTSKLAFATF